MSKALSQAITALREIQEQSAGPMGTYIGRAIAEVNRLVAEEAEAELGSQAMRLPAECFEVLRQVHARGFHGHTLEETARMLIQQSLVQFLPEKFEWCQPGQNGRVGLRKD